VLGSEGRGGGEGGREEGRDLPVPTLPLSGGKEKMVMARFLSLFCLRERDALWCWKEEEEGEEEGEGELVYENMMLID